jgi:hypothetical protein
MAMDTVRMNGVIANRLVEVLGKSLARGIKPSQVFAVDGKFRAAFHASRNSSSLGVVQSAGNSYN